ncbi:unnamed protein product [Protopolystoma xenopodis]|uniref:Uncharacterized protein n=1 Tax=Protopolystoma xenopodis TaxID=117903 RepID=A0A3S4ZJT2_9PLAT|nr:unnamed protein product [Protopolystoma xenopodis]
MPTRTPNGHSLWPIEGPGWIDNSQVYIHIHLLGGDQVLVLGVIITHVQMNTGLEPIELMLAGQLLFEQAPIVAPEREDAIIATGDVAIRARQMNRVGGRLRVRPPRLSPSV